MTKIIKMISLGILLLSLSQAFAKAPKKSIGHSNDLVVKSMSFNIRNGYANDKENRWDLRKELVYKVIQDYAADVLGLQEVNHKQLGELKKQFPEYGYLGVASNGGTKGQYSAIMYLKNRLKLVESGDFWISETPEKVSKSWRSAHIRICTWVRLKELKTSKELVVYNTHLDDGSRKAREKGAEMIMKHLHGQNLKNAFIVMGDFNAPEESQAIAQVKGSGAFINNPYPKAVDPFRVLYPEAQNVGTYNGFSGNDSGAKIDYIFVPTNAQVLAADILKTNQNGRYPSDHFPVTAQVCFKQVSPKVPNNKVDSRDTLPTYADVSYGPFERNKLDFWQAKGDGARPIHVYIHGGGWIQGDKTRMKGIKKYLDRGISVAAVNYRVTGKHPLPAPVHDAARAIQFLRFKAKDWNVDKNRFVLSGDSAGGCTSMWLACHDDLAKADSEDPVERESTRVQGIAVAGAQSAIDPKMIEPWIGPKVYHGMIISAVGEKNIDDVLKNYDQHQKMFHEFSPINHLSKDDPPMFMAYSADMTVPATSPGHAIHHGLFGVKMKEKSDAIGHQKVYVQIGKNRDPKYKNGDDFIMKILLN